MTNFPHFEMPKVDFPKIDFPKIERPTFELPEVDLTAFEGVVDFARDVAYVGVGLAVMTAERLQSLQQQWLEAMTTQLQEANAQLRAGVDKLVAQIKN